MLIYLTFYSVFVFAMVMSAAIGYVLYLAIDKFLPSTAIRHILGVVASVFTSYLITELLLSGVWYFYVITIGGGVMLYVWFVKIFSKHFE